VADFAHLRMGLTTHAPLMYVTKAQIITEGMSMGVDYSITSSCYDPADDGSASARFDPLKYAPPGSPTWTAPAPTRPMSLSGCAQASSTIATSP